jgi:hypothetical protein
MVKDVNDDKGIEKLAKFGYAAMHAGPPRGMFSLSATDCVFLNLSLDTTDLEQASKEPIHITLKQGQTQITVMACDVKFVEDKKPDCEDKKAKPWFKASRDTDLSLCKDAFRGLGNVRVVTIEGVELIGEFEAFFETASIGPAMEAHVIGDFRKADGSGKVAIRLHGVDEIWKMDKA